MRRTGAPVSAMATKKRAIFPCMPELLYDSVVSWKRGKCSLRRHAGEQCLRGNGWER